MKAANITTARFSHGIIAMMDSFLRITIHQQQEQFPLSAGLHASSKLKHSECINRRIYRKGIRAAK